MNCKLEIGKVYNLTGRIFCNGCGAVISQGGTLTQFAGHDHGFDVFHFIKALACPWCSTINEAAEMPCEGGPLISIGELVEQHNEAKS